MDGASIILKRIKEDCDESVREILQDAEDTCKKIISDAEAQADKDAAAAKAETERKAALLKSNSQSRAQLEKSNALLKRRREEIDKTVEGLHSYLTGLDDIEYFDTIVALGSKLSGMSGELYLNRRDLDRLPQNLGDRLREAGLNAEIQNTPVDISGGFILRQGGIEENMSFEAMISDRRDALEDLINKELFA